jgi:hypothetical protein
LPFFLLNISSKRLYAQLRLHFKWGYFLVSQTWMFGFFSVRGLAHRNSSCIRPFRNGMCNCPFWPRIFPQKTFTGSSWPYSCWVYNYLSNQFILPLTLRVWIPVRERCTTLYDKVCQWLQADLWLSPGTPSSSTNKIDCQDTTEIFSKVALNTIRLKPIKKLCYAQSI